MNGFTPLHIAAKKGYTEIAQLLLQTCPECISFPTDDNRNAFMLAALENQANMLTTFYDFFHDKNNAREDDIKFAKLFTSSVRAVDNLGNTVVHYCAWGGSMSCMQIVIGIYRLDHSIVNNEDVSPLQVAVAGNKSDMVSYLLSIQNDKLSKEEIVNSNVLVSDIILNNNDDNNNDYMVLSDTSSSGMNSFHRAALYGSLDTLKLLLDSSSSIEQKISNINSRTSNGSTPLQLAAKHGHFEMVHYLVSCNNNDNNNIVDLNAQNYFGLSSLLFACIGGYDDIAKYLIDHGADISVVTKEGQTLLHVVCEYGRHNIFKIIMESRKFEDLFAKDLKGRTATDAALGSGYKELAAKIAMYACIQEQTKELEAAIIDS
eukprot:gene8726-11790_t